MKGQELADFAISKMGMPYFYGAKMQTLTETFMASMHRQYPDTVTESYMKKARKKGMVGTMCVDCSGLIAGYRQKNIGSAQLYQTAAKRMPISDVKTFPVGTVLWKSGHVGVYIGIQNGEPMCVEAKGIDYGVIKSKVSATKWQYGLLFSDLEYYGTVQMSGSAKEANPYVEPIVLIRSGSTGNGAKWVQWELKEAGYNIKVDGIFGRKSVDALKKFQASCKIEVDGVCGAITREFLRKR